MNFYKMYEYAEQFAGLKYFATVSFCLKSTVNDLDSFRRLVVFSLQKQRDTAHTAMLASTCVKDVHFF